jgi:hypothetical protein
MAAIASGATPLDGGLRVAVIDMHPPYPLTEHMFDHVRKIVEIPQNTPITLGDTGHQQGSGAAATLR